MQTILNLSVSMHILHVNGLLIYQHIRIECTIPIEYRLVMLFAIVESVDPNSLYILFSYILKYYYVELNIVFSYPNHSTKIDF